MDDIIIPLISFLLIIGSSVLKSKSDDSKQAEKKTPKQMTPKSQPSQSTMQRMKPSPQVETSGDYSPYTEVKSEPELSTNQTMETQLRDLRDKLAVDSKKESDRKVKTSRQQMKKTTNRLTMLEPKQKVSSPIALKSQLTKSGLKRSVIMAEVLSAPRAKKPYQSKRYS